jgi:hypothetical protein
MPTISLTCFSFMKQIGGEIAALHRPTAAGRAPTSIRYPRATPPCSNLSGRTIVQSMSSDIQAFHRGGVGDMAHQERPQ